MEYTSFLQVEQQHTALALGSGDMEVLATPVMIALMENAAMLAIAPLLEEGMDTVGTAIQVEHTRASALGTKVSATARLTKQDGKQFHFEITASDEKGEIGKGAHVRFIVDRQRFMDRVGDNR